jgi:hypothetical protein
MVRPRGIDELEVMELLYESFMRVGRNADSEGMWDIQDADRQIGRREQQDCNLAYHQSLLCMVPVQ